jgi:cobalt-zinc-cadmium efflux system protein
MLADLSGVSLALLAIWFARRPATSNRTFGYYRAEVLAALVNAMILLGVAGFVVVEALRRIGEPPDILPGPMLAVAAIGLVVNLISVWLLHRAQAMSLNLRGAYLEVIGDLVGSLAVLGAGALIVLTGFTAADSLASLAIAAFIVPRAWSLLREAVDVLLQAAPRDVDLDEVRRHIVDTPGVADAHDLHAWVLTSGMNVVSAHVVVEEGTEPARILDDLCRCLSTDFDFDHSTFQLETADRRRHEGVRHP